MQGILPGTLHCRVVLVLPVVQVLEASYGCALQDTPHCRVTYVMLVAQILEASHGSKVCTLEGHSKPVLSVSMCRSMIATTSEDCTCCLFPPIKKAKASKRY